MGTDSRQIEIKFDVPNHYKLKVSPDHIILRMRKYLKAKENATDESKKTKAEYFCRSWLKWAGYYLLTHKERHGLYLMFKPTPLST